MRRKKLFRIPIANLTAAMSIESSGIERRNAVDATLPGEKPVPKRLHPFSDAGDRSQACDNSTPPHSPTKPAKNVADANVNLNTAFMVSFPPCLGWATPDTVSCNAVSCQPRDE